MPRFSLVLTFHSVLEHGGEVGIRGSPAPFCPSGHFPPAPPSPSPLYVPNPLRFPSSLEVCLLNAFSSPHLPLPQNATWLLRFLFFPISPRRRKSNFPLSRFEARRPSISFSCRYFRLPVLVDLFSSFLPPFRSEVRIPPISFSFENYRVKFLTLSSSPFAYLRSFHPSQVLRILVVTMKGFSSLSSSSISWLY